MPEMTGSNLAVCHDRRLKRALLNVGVVVVKAGKRGGDLWGRLDDSSVWDRCRASSDYRDPMVH